MIDIVTLFIVVLSFIAGSVITIAVIAYNNYKAIKRIAISSKMALEQFHEIVIPCKIEVIGDELFIYRRDNDLFLTKGLTIKQLEVDLKARFPDNLFDVEQKQIDEARAISILNERKTNAGSS